MRDKIKNFIEHSVPPGVQTSLIWKYMIFGCLGSLIYSFGFWGRYFDSYWDLFVRVGNETVLSGKMMPSFDSLYQSDMLGFKLCAVWCVAFVIHYYTYYRQGSKSVYLMKRLPSRLERHRRAFTIPCLMALGFLVLAALTVLVYFALYLIATPKECLLPADPHSIWRILL